MQQALIKDKQEADLSLSVVWTRIFPDDDETAARKATALIQGPNVRHFYDPTRRIGEALASAIDMPSVKELCKNVGRDPNCMESVFEPSYANGKAAVFDSCLFFKAGVRWEDKPTPPTAWVTQLDPATWPGIDEKRFHFGGALLAELRRFVRELKPTPNG